MASYDIVIFGATSFVGQILAHYLAEHCASEQSTLRWAIAGRSQSKLQQLKQALGTAGESLPLLIADAGERQQLDTLCESTRVVVSTVGPYAIYGEPLIQAWIESGTDYCDLTGEAQWVSKMIKRYEAGARQSGARIVHSCGFDSVPSDMGVFFLQQAAKARLGEPLTRMTMGVKALKGGASGGTIASILNIVKEASTNPALRKELLNPYSLCPEDHGFSVKQHFVKSPEFDRHFGLWAAPFVMAAINERVVHRSNALSGKAYGSDFRYHEAMLMGPGTKGRAKALALSAALGMFMAGAVTPPLRRLMERFVLPKPGEGPSPKEQQNGFFDLRFVGNTAAGDSLRAKVTGDRDPGYGSTAKILGQAAICLARHRGRTGGFWTPATLLGQDYIDALTAHAGLSFELK